MRIFLLIIVIIATGLIGFTYYTFLHKVSAVKGKTKTKWRVILGKIFQVEFESEHEENSKK